jgi:hypothetical protein
MRQFVKAGSPWGEVQTRTVLADGIHRVSTAGHGGILLSPQRWAELLAVIPDCKPFCGVDGALEEDCDWAYAGLVWPEFFSPAAIHSIVAFKAAYESVLKRVPESYWVGERGARVKEIAAKYLADHAEDYEPVGYYGSKERKVTHLRRVKDGQCISVEGNCYYDGPFIPAARVAEMVVVEPVAV